MLEKIFGSVPIPKRIVWVVDRMKKKSLLVVGAPEGAELLALKRKSRKMDVILKERKALIEGINYIDKPDRKYDYILYIGIDLNKYVYPEIVLKDGGKVFVVTPGGNGSRDLSRKGMIYSYTIFDLWSITGLEVTEAQFVRHGEPDQDGAVKSAVERRRLVQLLYAVLERSEEEE